MIRGCFHAACACCPATVSSPRRYDCASETPRLPVPPRTCTRQRATSRLQQASCIANTADHLALLASCCFTGAFEVCLSIGAHGCAFFMIGLDCTSVFLYSVQKRGCCVFEATEQASGCPLVLARCILTLRLAPTVYHARRCFKPLSGTTCATELPQGPFPRSDHIATSGHFLIAGMV